MASLIWKPSRMLVNHARRTAFIRSHIWRSVGTQPVAINVETSIQRDSLIPQLYEQNVGASSVIGQRCDMEDRYTIKMLTRNSMFLAVFDGHGGSSAVDFTVENLPKFISKALEKNTCGNYQLLLKEGFLLLNSELRGYLDNSSTGAERFSGTTAVVGLLIDGLHLHIAHVGDSRAILCRSGQAETLTWDHHPEHEDEKQRIEEHGGSVLTNSIGQPLVNGRLAMTRSIGDFDLKRYGVSAEPSYKYKKINHATDSFLVMVTDGITEVMSDEIITSTVLSNRTSAQESADQLTTSALHNHSHDNITVVVLPLGAWQKDVNPAVEPQKNFMKLHSRVRD